MGNGRFPYTGQTWSGEAADHQLATGLVGETAVTIIPTTKPVELVFYGSISPKLFWTMQAFVEMTEMTDLGAYFQFFRPSLWPINGDGSEEKLL